MANFLFLSIRETLLAWDNGTENASLLTAAEEAASGFLRWLWRSWWSPKDVDDAKM